MSETTETTERVLKLTWEGLPFHVTHEEYEELLRCAYDEPDEALRLAREYLAREDET